MFGLIVLIVITMVMAGCSSNRAPAGGSVSEGDYPNMEIRLGHLATEASNYQQLALKFKELVEERSGGKITVAIFPHRQLGGDRELMEAMQINTVDMGIITVSPMSSFVPEFFVHDLPFMFEDWDHALAYVKSDVNKEMLQKTEAAGLKSFAMMARGYQHLVNSKRPVHTPEDLKGLRIRVIESPYYVKGFEALGPQVVSMSFGEAFTAIQQGSIDGMENTIDVLHDERLYETTKYISSLNINFAFAVIMASKGIYDGWPPQVQELISSAAVEATDWINERNPQEEKKFYDILTKEKGMQLNEVDTSLFRPLVEGVYKEYIDQYGDEFVKKIEALR
jgi:tripartite ATP-independent transporter DctP family solute receptor